MRKIILILLVASIQLVYSQSTLTGKITDELNTPLMGASVIILDEAGKKGASTDFDGNYKIKNIYNGTYTVKISYIGYDGITKKVTFTGGTVTLNVSLKESTEALQEVEITGRKATTYKNEITYAARMAMPIKEAPIAINTVTKELIRDLNITSLVDVLKNTPGVVQYGDSGDKFLIRGFSNDNYFLYNGAKMQRSFWSPVRLPNIERVEVLMGSSSSLYGNASPGGSINLVTKKPLKNARNFLKFTSGSFETHRVEGDFTGPLDDNKKILYRLNTAYERSNGQFLASQTSSLFVAPSVTFVPNEKTNVNVELIIDKSDGIPDGPTPVRKFNIDKTPSDFSITQPSDYRETTRTSIITTLNHKFSDNLSLIATYLGSSYTTNQSAHDIWNVISENKYALNYSKWDVINSSNSYSVYLRGKYNLTENIEFNPIVGVDSYDNEYSSSYLVSIGESDGVRPFYIDKPEFSYRKTWRYKRNGLSNDFNEDIRTTNTIGGYIQGHFKINDKLNIVFNTRYEKFKSENLDIDEKRVTEVDAILPRFAVNYQVLENLNVYANYSKGFEPVPAYFQPIEGQEGFFDKPMTSVTYEAGIKNSLFNNKLATTVSAYYIPRENVVTRSNVNRVKNKQIDQVSRGIEFSANGRITSNWDITLNYAYNYVKVTKDPEEGKVVSGNVINNEGKQDLGAPFFLASMYTKYKIKDGVFKGIVLGLGGNYVSDRRSSFKGFIYPQYLVANASIFYNIGKFEMGLNINNITDKKYLNGGWGTTVTFGRPKNYNFSVGYRF